MEKMKTIAVVRYQDISVDPGWMTTHSRRSATIEAVGWIAFEDSEYIGIAMKRRLDDYNGSVGATTLVLPTKIVLNVERIDFP